MDIEKMAFSHLVHKHPEKNRTLLLAINHIKKFGQDNFLNICCTSQILETIHMSNKNLGLAFTLLHIIELWNH